MLLKYTARKQLATEAAEEDRQTHQKVVEIAALRRSAPLNSGATISNPTMKSRSFHRCYAAVGCRSATTTTTHTLPR
jgi:hypothetical protein